MSTSWLVLALLAMPACVGGQSGNEGAVASRPGDGPDAGEVADGGGGPGPSEGSNSGAAGGPSETNCTADAPCQGHGNDILEPEGRPRSSCPCVDFPGRSVVRGVVVTFREGRAEIQVHEVPSDLGCVDPEAPPVKPAVGERIGGYWDGSLPCDETCAPIAVGDSVLAFYARGDQDGLGCPDYRACSQERCGAQPSEGADEDADPSDAGFLDRAASWDLCDMDCLEETREGCAARADEARLNGQLALAPWSSHLDLGGYALQDEDAYTLAQGGELCEQAVTRLEPAPVAETTSPAVEPPPSEAVQPPPSEAVEPPPGDGGQAAMPPAVEPPPDEATAPWSDGRCAPTDAEIEPPTPPEPRLCGTPLQPALHGAQDVCEGSEGYAIECRDVCGTLSQCSDGAVACDECLQRCAQSPVDAQGPCLSRLVYLIDEEGCERMLETYASYDPDAQCGR